MFSKSLKPWLLLLVVLIGSGYFLREEMEQKRIAGIGPVADRPIQESIDAVAMQKNGYAIEPVASYRIRAKVLSLERYRTGREADLSPVDFALGWGPMSQHEVTAKLNISQSDRWYSYSWDNDPPIDPADIIRYSANTHLVPADDAVKSQLLRVRAGEIVHLEGYLINVKHPDGWTWRTSLTREDTGSGACELMWVEKATIEH